MKIYNIFQSGGDDVEIIEKFVDGKKSDPVLCEDLIFVSENFIAVVDGVTSKNQKSYNGLAGGRAAAEKVCETVSRLKADADVFSAVAEITKNIANLYETNEEKGSVAASAIIYSDYYKEIWSIGDCQCIINGEFFSHEKEIDRVNSEMRSLILELHRRSGKTDEDFLQNDVGREFIMPVLQNQHIFANATGKYSYGILNGTTVPEEHIVVHKVKSGDEIVLASDGYPYLKETLEESEKLLREELKNNPLCDKGYVSTKGISKGNKSFDDRAYIRFKV